MKKLLVIIAVSLSLSVSAAGIKIKKAIKAGNAKVNAELANVKTACGNAELEVSVDWSKWESYKLDASKHETTIGYAATLVVNEVFGNMIEACKDADYKEAIAEVKKVVVSGKDNFSDTYIDFKYADGTLNATLNGDGYGSWKNKDLFMAIW